MSVTAFMYVEVKYDVLPRIPSAGDLTVNVVPDMLGAVGDWYAP